MNFGGLFFLLLVHFMTGRGLVELFKLDLNPLRKFCISMLCGVGIASLVPFILELFHIEISFNTLSIGLSFLAIVFFIPVMPKMRNLKMLEMKRIKIPELYEYPFIVIFILLIALSLWRCYYNPPFAWDMLSGPEVMADLAVKEKHIINSLFSVDLQYTNNYLKPPYVTSLQIIYKIFVQPFGQVWLSVLFVSFILFVFSLLREKLHPVIMYFIMFFFFAMPETYAYSYIILFDYSNMIFFFLGFYFLNRFFENKSNYDFAFCLFTFCIATYIRSETLVLLAMVLPLIIFRLWKEKQSLIKIGIKVALFMIFPYFIYFLLMNIFINHYIPIHFDVTSQVNKHLGDLSILTNRWSDIASLLIFGEYGVTYFGFFIYTYVIVLILDLLFFRKFNTEAITAIYGVFVVFFGLGFLGYLLPLVDLNHTTKRGMFKMFPLMLLYFCNSGILIKISDFIRNYEMDLPLLKAKEIKPELVNKKSVSHVATKPISKPSTLVPPSTTNAKQIKKNK